MRDLTVAEFKWALIAGHGCALQYIKLHGDSQPDIRALLKEASIVCPSIDPQVDPRSSWVAEMISHTSRPEDYLREIQSHPYIQNDRDSMHRAEILFEFARLGSQDILAFIVPHIVEFNLQYDWLTFRGFTGILDIIEQWERPDEWSVTSIYQESCSLASESEVRELLGSSNTPKVRAFLEQLDTPPKARPEESTGTFDLRQIFPDATNQRLVSQFRNATSQDFDRILHWLEGSDSKYRFIVMNSWARLGLPLHKDSEFLLKLAQNSDAGRDCRAACQLLGTRPTEPVIELGESYLHQGEFGLATVLLKNAWRPEYTAVMQSHLRLVIPETEDELDAHHDLATHSVALMGHTNHPSLLPLAEWVTQFNPCCYCRECSIEFLAEHGALNPELASEFQFDASKFE